MPVFGAAGGQIVGATGGSPAASAARELLARNILSVEEVVRRGILLTERSVSHRSFRVDLGGEPTLFMKQADVHRSQGRDLTTEAEVYRIARSSAAFAEVIPECRLISADNSLIVLEAVAGTSLAETPIAAGDYTQAPSGPDARSVLCRYGRAVARMHDVRPQALGQPPWLLVALEPGWGTYAWLPDPCRELLLRLAGTPNMRQGFRLAAATWRTECLIHGDLRWANVLVMRGTDPPGIYLVDFELACLGDPAWDLGSVLADLLAAAGAAGPTVDRGSQTWSAAHAFFEGYRVAASTAPDQWLDLIQRSVRLAGVRLVQTLVEYGHQGKEFLSAMEPVLLPWAAQLLTGSPPIVAELARHDEPISAHPA